MSGGAVMSDTPRDCKHGHLARSCEICELERDLAAATERIAALERERDEQARGNTIFQHKAMEMRAEVERLERERDAQREEVDLLTSRCLEYERDIAALERERDALQEALRGEAEDNVRLRAQTDATMMQEIADLNAEVERLRALLRECVESMEEYRSLEEFTGNNSEWCKRIRAALGEE